MKTHLPKIDTSKLAGNKTTRMLLLLVVFIGAISYSSIRIYKATIPARLPANSACIALSYKVEAALEGSQAQIVAVFKDKPKPAYDLTAVKTALKDCRDNAQVTTVKVSK